MSHVELVARVRKMVEQPSSALDAPIVYELPDGTSLAELITAVRLWAGQPRNLAMGGFTDPSLVESTGAPLVEQFGGELEEMRGWAYKSHWIGCGRIARSGEARTIVVVADRRDPAVVGFPEGASWAEKLRILVGWESTDRTVVDWPATEAALGTPLPSDYKEIVEVFGPGCFDDYLDLLVPGTRSSNILLWFQNDAVHAAELWEPYSVYPTPGGLLRWGASEQEITFVWQTGAPDPDDWRVLVEFHFDEWERYDCGMGEFLVRMLTDVQFGFPTRRISTHYFTPNGH
ncbi:hypothetical protein ABZ348_23285 [Streptomyces sp. NPDC005963]|uniref:hypothetical protein n=1 Tax=Streptomyces sp. NPDC005963 TaxID=3156721 RepID=UPI0033E615FF